MRAESLTMMELLKGYGLVRKDITDKELNTLLRYPSIRTYFAESIVKRQRALGYFKERRNDLLAVLCWLPMLLGYFIIQAGW